MHDYGRLRKHGELFGLSFLHAAPLNDFVRITPSRKPSFSVALAYGRLRPCFGGVAYQRLSTVVAAMKSMADVSVVAIKQRGRLLSTPFGTENPYY